MNSKEYIELMTNIQQNLLEYIDNEDPTENDDKFKNIKDLLTKIKIQEKQYELKLFLLSKIYNNHHRTDNFSEKIDQILSLLKDEIRKYFTNSELFRIFKNSKKILLFLFEEKIMKFDEFIVKHIIKKKFNESKYPQYFQPEIKPFIREEWFPKYYVDEEVEENKWVLEIEKEIPEDFYEKRKIGENEKNICKLIRKDLLDDFIIYINQNNCQPDSTINQSIYETNNFLLKNEKIALIEYAAFYGSIQIFNYLRLKNVELTPSLWKYAIHGKNAEIIQILEENNIELQENESYEQLFKESVKCHHNDFAYHIQNNYLENIKEDKNFYSINGIKYYNFVFIDNDMIFGSSFNYLCKYDYYTLVFIILNTSKIDINMTTISK